MIGVDLIKVKRIERFLAKFQAKALQRFLDKEEINLCKNIKSIAGFWAAKEAAAKALKLGIGKECSFLDIKISKNNKGAPLLSYSKSLQEKFSIKNVDLSITHDGDYALAVVAVETI